MTHGPAPDEGLRERKKRATRAAIGSAALRLAVRHGLDEITVEQIAGEADVAVRTFRNYFSGKDEAAVFTAEAGASALVALFRARPADEPVSRALHAAVLELVDDGVLVAPDQVAVLLLIRDTPSLNPARLALLSRQETDLAAAITARTGVGDGFAARAAAAVFAVLRVVLDRWLAHADDVEHTAPPIAVLRTELADAVHDLAAGLDSATDP